MKHHFRQAVKEAILLNHAFVAMIHDTDAQAFQSGSDLFRPSQQQVYHSDYSTLPIGIDKSFSVSVTPIRADFVGPIREWGYQGYKEKQQSKVSVHLNGLCKT